MQLIIIIFIAVVVDVVLVNEAAVVVLHCELVVVCKFGAVAAYVVDVLDSRVAFTFHFAAYLVTVAMLNPFGRFKVHVDVVLLVLLILQKVLNKLVHLTDWF